MCDHHNNIVVDTRPNEFGTRRRRECVDCGHRWTTQELTIEPNADTGKLGRTFDPWAEYRKLAIREWLGKQYENMTDV